MQSRDQQIERARNEQALPFLGDPERWGGDGQVVVPVPLAIAPTDTTRYSSQIVRAQVNDLTARAWEVVCHYKIEGLDPTDVHQLALELTLGGGQTSFAGLILISPAIATSPPSWWIRTVTEGTIQVTSPVPAVAIAARLRLNVKGTGVPASHDVTATGAVIVAPRALL
jgi:hypothetical protein